MFLILILISYVVGSIPFGFLIGKLKGVDVKKIGSGNIGGMNVGRALGLKYAVLVIGLDAFKGMITTLIAANLYSKSSETILVGLAVIVGHVFSIFLKFKGGKGIATTIGVALVVVDINYFLICLLCWVILLKITKIMSLTNLLSFLALPLYFLVFQYNQIYFIATIIIIAILYWAHRDNIRRLLKGNESKLSF